MMDLRRLYLRIEVEAMDAKTVCNILKKLFPSNYVKRWKLRKDVLLCLMQLAECSEDYVGARSELNKTALAYVLLRVNIFMKVLGWSVVVGDMCGIMNWLGNAWRRYFGE